MTLVEVQITNLRNILSARLSFHPHFNLISGHNGSGKTSFLEALYLLATGHSFRTREISALVSHDKDMLTVFAKSSYEHRISIQKSPNLPTIARLDGKPCLTSSELAAFLPCQLFYQDIFQLIDAGPTVRRNLLDWGLFHVEPSYHAVWKNYRRTLHQRNTLLRQKAKAGQLLPWNEWLSTLAFELDRMRAGYMQQWVEKFNPIIAELMNVDCFLHYYKGWDRKNEGKSLQEVLDASIERDLVRQFTHYGAHQADLLVESRDVKVKHFLSRGQQKMLLFALKFAQAQLVTQSCIYLIDDLTSELDEKHIQRLLNYISLSDGQFFVTTRPTDKHLLTLASDSYAHHSLENGVFLPSNV